MSYGRNRCLPTANCTATGCTPASNTCGPLLALGLRNGDLVLSVNGTPLDDPARGNEIFSSLGNSDQARVTVIRNGQQQDITLNMSQIANQAEQLGNGADQTAPGAATGARKTGPPVPARPPTRAFRTGAQLARSLFRDGRSPPRNTHDDRLL